MRLRGKAVPGRGQHSLKMVGMREFCGCLNSLSSCCSQPATCGSIRRARPSPSKQGIWVRRGRSLVLATAALATVSGSASGFTQAATALPPDSNTEGGSSYTETTNGSSDTGHSESDNDSDRREAEARRKAADERRAEAAKQKEAEPVYYDAFGDEYETAEAAQNADVVTSANASIANIEVTGGSDTDYSVIADPGVYKDGDHIVVVGSANKNETIVFRTDGSGVAVGDTWHDLDIDSDDQLAVFANSGGSNILGSDLDETIVGGDGDDFVRARGGNDKVFGGAGNDHLLGNDGNDSLSGGDGDDGLRGGGGDDDLNGDDGRDNIYGGRDNDDIDGGDGDDYLEGGSGHDRLKGGSGNDIQSGGLGEDWLDGGAGADVLVGGPGADRYIEPEKEDRLHHGRSAGLPSNIKILSTDPEFIEQATADLIMISQLPSGRKLLDEIEAAGKQVSISEDIGVYSGSATAIPFTTDVWASGRPAMGGKTKVTYSPLISGEDPLNFRTPATILMHELIHAKDNATGTGLRRFSVEVNSEGLPGRNDAGQLFFTPDTELRTVGLPYGHGTDLDSVGDPSDLDLDRVTENSFRADLGIEPREQYKLPITGHSSEGIDRDELRDFTDPRYTSNRAFDDGQGLTIEADSFVSSDESPQAVNESDSSAGRSSSDRSAIESSSDGDKTAATTVKPSPQISDESSVEDNAGHSAEDDGAKDAVDQQVPGDQVVLPEERVAVVAEVAGPVCVDEGSDDRLNWGVIVETGAGCWVSGQATQQDCVSSGDSVWECPDGEQYRFD